MRKLTNSFTRFSLKHQPKGYVPKHNSTAVDFSNLVNALGFSDKVRKAIPRIDLNLINRYGDRSHQDIKKNLSDWFKIKTENISLGNGSDELIDSIARVFLEPRETVVVQVPSFFRFIEASLKMKGKVIKVGVHEIIKTVQKNSPKLVWLCSPNNPTGEILSQATILKIAKTTPGLVIVDEAYQEIFDPENKQSAIHLLSKQSNILVLKSFSKGFGLAGIRVGIVIGNRKIIHTLEKLRLNFNISILSQKIAGLALDHRDFLNKSALFFKREREWLFTRIKQLKNIKLGGDSKTNVFIMKHKIKDLYKELLKRNIVTADFRQANGLEGKGFVRVTIKTRKENLKLLKALKDID